MMAQSGSGGGEIEVPNGIYIQDTDGVLWQKAAWDGSATPNGVAVVTDECRFVIAMIKFNDLDIAYDGYSSAMRLPVFSTYNEAITDYSGESNTEAIISAFYDAGAADYCKGYTFPNGNNGYLGSAGEWQTVKDNFTDIDDCLLEIGANSVYYEISWTSTRGEDNENLGDNSFWKAYVNRNTWACVAASSTGDARPFTELGEVTGIVEA